MSRKPKVTVKRAAGKATRDDRAARSEALDSFQNFAANLGMGTDNVHSASSYGFNPITRVRTLLEWIHRGSWIGGLVVDVVADDMTRAGVEIQGTTDPDLMDDLEANNTALGVWTQINETLKWARLYGGALAVMLIDGQDFRTPLRPERISKGMFKGLLPLDRWMVEPSLDDLITDFGPDLGLPKYYKVGADAPALRNQVIHHSRVIRVEGLRLPYQQRLQENLWGLSVFEPLYDRMIAFDSATTGVAQLVYKSHVRTYQIEGLRELASTSGRAYQGLVNYVNMMRRFQSVEGVILIDKNDEYISDSGGSVALRGVSEVLLQFAEQLSGAVQIPLVRLLGQAPTGMNSAGESELRTYYDGILQKQNRTLLNPITTVYRVSAASAGITLENDFRVVFKSLWQLEETEKATIAKTIVDAVTVATDSGLLSIPAGMRELRQQSDVSGVFSNITDEEIEEAENMPPMIPGMMGPGAQQPGYEAPPAAELARLQANDRAFTGGYGLDVVIETPRGSVRSGKGWSVALPADYGYLRGYRGADGEDLDCFIGPDPLKSCKVWLINSTDPETGKFDEHKIMMGFGSKKSALGCFNRSYDDDAEGRVGSVHELTFDEFRVWLEDGNLTEAYQPALRVVR